MVVRRLLVRIGVVLACLGVALLVWVVVVWFWQDPFTGLYTRYEQHELAEQYGQRVARFKSSLAGVKSDAGELRVVAREAARYRLESYVGEAMGTIDVPRLGLHRMLLVDGTDESSLEKGPGVYRGDFLPGEHELVYVAGHRTTFLAPFAVHRPRTWPLRDAWFRTDRDRHRYAPGCFQQPQSAKPRIPVLLPGAATQPPRQHAIALRQKPRLVWRRIDAKAKPLLSSLISSTHPTRRAICHT